MKTKINKISAIYKYLISDQLVKIMIVVNFIYIICGAINGKSLCMQASITPNFIDVFYNIFSNPGTNVYLVFITLLISGIGIYKRFEKNTGYLLRLKSKRKYLIELLKKVFIGNTIIFVFLVLVSLIITYFLVGPTFIINEYGMRKTTNLIYTILYLFRIFGLGQLLSLISVLLIKFIDYRLVILANGLFQGIIFCHTYILERPVNSIIEMPLFIGDYIFANCVYRSLFLEVIISLIYLLGLFIILQILYQFTLRKMKRIG